MDSAGGFTRSTVAVSRGTLVSSGKSTVWRWAASFWVQSRGRTRVWRSWTRAFSAPPAGAAWPSTWCLSAPRPALFSQENESRVFSGGRGLAAWCLACPGCSRAHPTWSRGKTTIDRHRRHSDSGGELPDEGFTAAA